MFVINAQLLDGDLGQRCFKPLANGVDPGPDLKAAIRRQANGRLLEARYQRQSPTGKDLGAVRRLFRKC